MTQLIMTDLIWIYSAFKFSFCCVCHFKDSNDLSRVVRKPDFCICENKDADQLREADQRLCFRYTDSTIPLLPTYEILSLYPPSVAVQTGLCRTWSETPKTGFLRTRLILELSQRPILLVMIAWAKAAVPLFGLLQ